MLATDSKDARSSALRDPRLWLIGGVVALAAIAIVVAVYLARRGPSLAAAKLPPIPTRQTGAGLLRADVGSVNGTALQVSNGSDSQTVTAGPNTRVEALLPIAPSDIAVGDYLTVGGLPNLVYTFAIKLVVDMPADVVDANGSGPPRSKAGFTAWEAYKDANQGPEVYGKVEAIDADGVHLNGSLGPITVKLDEQSPLRRLTMGGVDLIHGGDHVAIAGKSSSAPDAILVLPGQ